MKKFHELTTEQQGRAVVQATRELTECMKLGMIEFHDQTKETIARYGRLAAEGSLYSNVGDAVLEEAVEN